eukprot:TRINITY_DN1481_c0_g1_i2.p1 TRINITY_DN1481_c0_g1~~TRINITY_DN1481_c0_g1_i2.p1  ORF type:complete len:134 (+),score=16.41 TRINITY_DN1481_c0_g1_i2:870-1271(+)
MSSRIRLDRQNVRMRRICNWRKLPRKRGGAASPEGGVGAGAGSRVSGRRRRAKEVGQGRKSLHKGERNGESVTSEMFTQVQEMLQIFGVPYIIAPMKAEVQCAFLDMAGIVDSIVMGDCDVFRLSFHPYLPTS